MVVVGALGSVSKKLAGHLEQLGIKNRTRTMQKSALLGSAHILRKVLEVWSLGMRLAWVSGLPKGLGERREYQAFLRASFPFSPRNAWYSG